MKDRYDDSPVSAFADYVLFLGYAGLILRQALATAAPRTPFFAIWGFHDGDLFPLARRPRARTRWFPTP
jgi:hypothetical protein